MDKAFRICSRESQIRLRSCINDTICCFPSSLKQQQTDTQDSNNKKKAPSSLRTSFRDKIAKITPSLKFASKSWDLDHLPPNVHSIRQLDIDHLKKDMEVLQNGHSMDHLAGRGRAAIKRSVIAKCGEPLSVIKICEQQKQQKEQKQQQGTAPALPTKYIKKETTNKGPPISKSGLPNRSACQSRTSEFSLEPTSMIRSTSTLSHFSSIFKTNEDTLGLLILEEVRNKGHAVQCTLENILSEMYDVTCSDKAIIEQVMKQDEIKKELQLLDLQSQKNRDSLNSNVTNASGNSFESDAVSVTSQSVVNSTVAAVTAVLKRLSLRNGLGNGANQDNSSTTASNNTMTESLQVSDSIAGATALSSKPSQSGNGNGPTQTMTEDDGDLMSLNLRSVSQIETAHHTPGRFDQNAFLDAPDSIVSVSDHDSAFAVYHDRDSGKPVISLVQEQLDLAIREAMKEKCENNNKSTRGPLKVSFKSNAEYAEEMNSNLHTCMKEDKEIENKNENDSENSENQASNIARSVIRKIILDKNVACTGTSMLTFGSLSSDTSHNSNDDHNDDSAISCSDKSSDKDSNSIESLKTFDQSQDLGTWVSAFEKSSHGVTVRSSDSATCRKSILREKISNHKSVTMASGRGSWLSRFLSSSVHDNSYKRQSASGKKSSSQKELVASQ